MNTYNRLLLLGLLGVLAGCQTYQYAPAGGGYYHSRPSVYYEYPPVYDPYYPYYPSHIGLYDYPVIPAYPAVYPPPRRVIEEDDAPMVPLIPSNRGPRPARRHFQGSPWEHLNQFRRHNTN